jgi:hypothetical protein
MAVTRTIKATIDKFFVNAGTEITYLGTTAAGNIGDLVRGFRVSPSGTGNIIVNIDRSNNLLDISIFQEDSVNGSAAPAGYARYFNVGKAGKEKGAVAAAVTNATKKYIVLLKFDNYSDASYSGNVTIP